MGWIPIDAGEMADKYKQIRPMTLTYCRQCYRARTVLEKNMKHISFQPELISRDRSKRIAASQLGVWGCIATHQAKIGPVRVFSNAR